MEISTQTHKQVSSSHESVVVVVNRALCDCRGETEINDGKIARCRRWEYFWFHFNHSHNSSRTHTERQASSTILNCWAMGRKMNEDAPRDIDANQRKLVYNNHLYFFAISAAAATTISAGCIVCIYLNTEERKHIMHLIWTTDGTNTLFQLKY